MGYDFTLEIRPDERTIVSVVVDTKEEIREVSNIIQVGLTYQWKDRKRYHAWALISNGSEAADGLRILGFPIPLDRERQDAININFVKTLMGLDDQDIINISHLLQ
jgi:hypothetical protein